MQKNTLTHTSKYDKETKSGAFMHTVVLAEESFADHVITTKGERVWRCGKPDTGIYAFMIGELPGAIVMWGDIGSLIIDAGTAYDVRWLCGSIRSYNYILEKSSLAKKTHFYTGEFRQMAIDREMNELIDNDDWSEEAFVDYVRDTGDSDAYDTVYGYPFEVLWCYQGLKKFTELLVTQ